jgi:hypothetical protein
MWINPVQHCKDTTCRLPGCVARCPSRRFEKHTPLKFNGSIAPWRSGHKKLVTAPHHWRPASCHTAVTNWKPANSSFFLTTYENTDRKLNWLDSYCKEMHTLTHLSFFALPCQYQFTLRFCRHESRPTGNTTTDIIFGVRLGSAYWYITLT